MPSFIPPAFRTEMAASCYWRRCSVSFHSWKSCLLTAPIKARFSAVRLRKPCPVSEPKSSSDPITRKGSCSYPSVDRGTYDCVAQSLPPARQGLGKSQPHCHRFLEIRFRPPHAPKTL